MQFGVAIKRLKVGEAAKTASMSGYVKKIENTTQYKTYYPYQLVFKNKDGVESVFDMKEDGSFDKAYQPSPFQVNEVILGEIAYGDWDVMPVDKAESERTNPKIW